MSGRVPASDGSWSGTGINVSFRWVKQHVSSCPFFRTGVACCLPTCAQGLSVPVTLDYGVGFGVFGAFWLLLGVLYIWGLLVFLASLLCTKLGLFWGASNWARPLGVVWLGRSLSNLVGECLAAHKIAWSFFRFVGI